MHRNHLRREIARGLERVADRVAPLPSANHQPDRLPETRGPDHLPEPFDHGLRQGNHHRPDRRALVETAQRVDEDRRPSHHQKLLRHLAAKPHSTAGRRNYRQIHLCVRPPFVSI